MIPRFRPRIGRAELEAALNPPPDAVARFEREFASAFGCEHGVAFSYGRSALFALLKLLEFEGHQVIVPAYTCSVVAHAVTLANSRCRFVDVTMRDYNMDLDEVASAIHERTAALVATHLFGFPLDVDRLRDIVDSASRRVGRPILVIQDCAHAFGARWKGRLVAADRDVALFGLNISKSMHSIFGGMVTTNDGRLAQRLRSWRDAHFRPAGASKGWMRRAYLAAAAAAFAPPAYSAVRWLQDATPVLDHFARAYHLDDRIAFPPDYDVQMSAVEAAVGLVELQAYEAMQRRRSANAAFYQNQLRPPADWVMPPRVDGATWSHFPIRVPDKQTAMRSLLVHGVQLGEVIEYSVPHLSSYGAEASMYPNSLRCSQSMINLPVGPQLTAADRDVVVNAVNRLGAPAAPRAGAA